MIQMPILDKLDYIMAEKVLGVEVSYITRAHIQSAN